MSENNDDELQLSHRKKIVDALDYLAAGLKPYVELQLQQRYRDAWEDNISRAKGGHAPKLADPYVLLATIDDHWNTFDTCFKFPQSIIKQLRKDRNAAVHHSELFSAEEVNNSISSMLRLLKSIPTSQKSIKMVEKIGRLKYQLDSQAEALAPTKPIGQIESQDSNEYHDAPVAETTENTVSLSASGLALDDRLQGNDASMNNGQGDGFVQLLPTQPVMENPSITYDYNRLCFKAKHIEPLRADQAFRVVTPVGTFQMTKAQFYSAFPKVVVSKSYSESGIYHYPSVPKSALPYKLTE